MKRNILLYIVVAAFPLLLFLNVWQSYRYEKLKTTLSKLGEEQKEWIEKNKQLITSIEILSSPERIESLAKELDLSERELERLVIVYFTDSQESVQK